MRAVAFVVVLGCASCAMLGSWGYFRHYEISRPPIGVFTLTDIVIMLLMVILVPLLYLVLPLWLVVCLLALAASLAWGSSGMTLGIGLGDVLLAGVFPLVVRKAFGRRAGIAALALALCAVGTLLALPLRGLFPAMVVLGPLMLLQYLWWRR